MPRRTPRHEWPGYVERSPPARADTATACSSVPQCYNMGKPGLRPRRPCAWGLWRVFAPFRPEDSQRASQEGKTLEARELANRIVDTISDHLGEDIVLLDIREVSPLADFFVIASGTSERQLRALLEELAKLDDVSGHRPRLEGEPESGWVLLDHGGVVTHLFSPEKRQFYRLEEIWRTARVVVHLQ